MTTKKEKDTQPNEAEIIFNRANVALARSQRLVASWLNSPSSSTDEHKDQEAADVKDDDEIFTPVPERLGLGASLPSSSSAGVSTTSQFHSGLGAVGTRGIEDDELRKKILGRNWKKIIQEQQKKAQTQKLGLGAKEGVTQRPSRPTRKEEDADEDEEEGRSAIAGRAKSRKKTVVEDTTNGEDGGGDNNASAENTATSVTGAETKDEEGAASAPPSKKPRRAGAATFLDEILSDRARKKKKRGR